MRYVAVKTIYLSREIEAASQREAKQIAEELGDIDAKTASTRWRIVIGKKNRA